MNELLLGGSAWWIVPTSLLVFGATFGLLPGLMLRLLVQLYPKDDPRRRELFAELYGPRMSRLGRFEWVFQQLETAIRDGLAARRELRRRLVKLAATREDLVAYIRREFAEFARSGVTVTCERDDNVRHIFGPDDLTTDDMAGGTRIIITGWGIRQRPLLESSGGMVVDGSPASTDTHETWPMADSYPERDDHHHRSPR